MKALESTEKRRPALTRLQWFFITLGWALFLLAWVSAMRQTQPMTIFVTLAVLLTCAIAIESVTLYWISHNVNIFRKKGPRKSLANVDHEFRRDFVGRELEADWERLREEGVILISQDEEHKTFVPYEGGITTDEVVGRMRRLKLRVVAPPPEERDAI